MTKLPLLLFLAIWITGCNITTQPGDKSEKTDIATSELTEISLHVKGMTCEGCENAIVLSLSKVEGVYESNASHVKELVIVKYDAVLTNQNQITEAITRVGYEVVGEVTGQADTE